MEKFIAKNLKGGICVSDPSYDKDVWCRYSLNKDLSNFLVVFDHAQKEEEYEFKGKKNQYLADYYTLVLAVNENVLNSIKFNTGDGSISHPTKYSVKQVEIGIDTASIFIGTNKDFATWGNSMDTGSDGMFGTLFQFTYERKKVAIVLQFYMDNTFNTSEDVLEYLKGNLYLEEVKE